MDAAVNDMMAAAQYPQLTFASPRISTKPQGQFEIQGNLTVRGMAKPITFIAAAKPSGIDRLGIDVDAEINLKDCELMTLRFLVWAERSSA